MFATCTSIETVSVGFLDLRCSRWRRSSRLPGLDILWSFIPIALPVFALVVPWTFAQPAVSRFAVLMTDCFLGDSSAIG